RIGTLTSSATGSALLVAEVVRLRIGTLTSSATGSALFVALVVRLRIGTLTSSATARLTAERRNDSRRIPGTSTREESPGMTLLILAQLPGGVKRTDVERTR